MPKKLPGLLILTFSSILLICSAFISAMAPGEIPTPEKFPSSGEIPASGELQTPEKTSPSVAEYPERSAAPEVPKSPESAEKLKNSESAAPPESQTSSKGLERFEFEGIEMAVPIRIVLYAPDSETARKAADEALARFHDLNGSLSDYDENSEIRKFCDNALPEEFIRVSSDLWNVLRRAVWHAELSDGAFDPTVGQVVRLWRHARKSHRLPPANRLAETLQTVGWKNILFDESNHAIALSQNGAKNHVRLDLGGVAKGYAVDEALRVMRLSGVSRALVDAGGDIGLGDPPPGKTGWTIAVASLKKGEKPTDFWILSNCGVANSGDMFQFAEIDGKRYSHIVDPKTGLGLTNRLTVSVVAPNAVDADALASAVSVLGPERGMKLIESLPDTEVQILQIAPDGEILKYGKNADVSESH